MGTNIIEYKATPTYTSVESAIIQAQLNQPLIVNESEYELIKACANVLNKAHIDSGIQIKGDSYQKQQVVILQMAKSVAADLKKYFKTITIKEFELAVEAGIRKEYGDYFGINVSTIHVFCKAYKDSFDRSEVIRKKKLISEPEPKPSDEQIEKIMIQSCLKAFEEYKSGKNMVDFGGSKFSYLRKIGLINLTDERYNQIFEQAKKKVTSEASVTLIKSGTDTTAWNIAGQVLKSPDKHEITKNAARLIALTEYFDYLVENKFELQDLIEETILNKINA